MFDHSCFAVNIAFMFAVNAAFTTESPRKTAHRMAAMEYTRTA
jgi:hypothetical protein